MNPWLETSERPNVIACHRYWNIHRADYQSLLAKVAAKYNVEIVFGAKLKWIDTDGVCAFCSDGRSFRADVIIEADGMLPVSADGL